MHSLFTPQSIKTVNHPSAQCISVALSQKFDQSQVGSIPFDYYFIDSLIWEASFPNRNIALKGNTQ